MPEKGDMVKIFDNYIRREQLEGFAELVEQLREPQREKWNGKWILVHYWYVRFEGETSKYQRFFTTDV